MQPKKLQKKIFLFLIFCAVTVFLCTCSKNESKNLPANEIVDIKEMGDHKWYYIGKNGFSEIDLPQKMPQQLFKPWTEAERVSSSAHIGLYSYFLINKVGLLQFKSGGFLPSNAELFFDKDIFDSTVNGLVSVDDEPVFSVYKSSFFNTQKSKIPFPFLVQFRAESGFFIPLLNAADIDMPQMGQPVQIVYDGKNWLAAFKSIQNERVVFNYVRFFSYEPLLSLNPAKRKTFLQKETLTADVFKQQTMPDDFSKSPQALKQLLAQLPKNLSFQIDCYMPNSSSPVTYVQNRSETAPPEFYANALVTQDFSIAVFRDGTSYFSGALPKKYVLKNGKTVTFRLPKLPRDFIYTFFVIADDFLYVAWEEDRFFETGGAGFLAVDLEKVLYK